jgi:hypothetical protein
VLDQAIPKHRAGKVRRRQARNGAWRSA